MRRWSRSKAALIATSTIGDEPMIATQIQRPGFHQRCTRALEESLRLGSAQRDNLNAVQLRSWPRPISRG